MKLYEKLTSFSICINSTTIYIGILLTGRCNDVGENISQFLTAFDISKLLFTPQKHPAFTRCYFPRPLISIGLHPILTALAFDLNWAFEMIRHFKKQDIKVMC